MRLKMANTIVNKIMGNRVERTDMIPSRRKISNMIPKISQVSRFSQISTIALIAASLTLAAGPAEAQETTGRIIGHVTDMGTGQPLVGITVILQGQQGEDAALTDDQGAYTFVNLAVGTYVVRFYNANSSTKVERADLAVSAGATLRADAAIPSQAAVEETYVIKKKAAAVDVGSTRIGMTVDEDYMKNVPLDLTFGDLVLKAPGAFLESSGGVSIAGSSGLENVYVMNGLNVTGMEYGDIMNKTTNASGGSNLTLDFLKEVQVNTGGYNAEFGGAMGGVVNVVTKSGSNDYHGSAFMYWSPYWMSANPKLVLKANSALVGVDKPDYDTNVGFEVGGPIIKNKLFFWVGFAPRFEKSHFFRDAQALVDDTGPDGRARWRSGYRSQDRATRDELPAADTDARASSELSVRRQDRLSGRPRPQVDRRAVPDADGVATCPIPLRPGPGSERRSALCVAGPAQRQHRRYGQLGVAAARPALARRRQRGPSSRILQRSESLCRPEQYQPN